MLAMYLKDLANDVPRYIRMLEEKEKLRIATRSELVLKHWCKLCERMHPRPKNTYWDVHKDTHNKKCWPKSGYNNNNNAHKLHLCVL
jgi:hypothetical protein